MKFTKIMKILSHEYLEPYGITMDEMGYKVSEFVEIPMKFSSLSLYQRETGKQNYNIISKLPSVKYKILENYSVLW